MIRSREVTKAFLLTIALATPFDARSAPAKPVDRLTAPPAQAPEVQIIPWHVAFPETPPFSQWVKAGTFRQGGEDGTAGVWLHSRSIRPLGGNQIRVDALMYTDSGPVERHGYVRLLLDFECNSFRRFLIQFDAKVVIDPVGTLVPASPVRGRLHVGFATQYPGNLHDALCYDSAFRVRFQAA
jgi:hypothetical protein